MDALLAHAGHPVYDHPAMAAIGIAAIVIPLIVLGVVGRIFVRSAREERERDQRRSATAETDRPRLGRDDVA